MASLIWDSHIPHIMPSIMTVVWYIAFSSFLCLILLIKYQHKPDRKIPWIIDKTTQMKNRSPCAGAVSYAFPALRSPYARKTGREQISRFAFIHSFRTDGGQLRIILCQPFLRNRQHHRNPSIAILSNNSSRYSLILLPVIRRMYCISYWHDRIYMI